MTCACNLITQEAGTATQQVPGQSELKKIKKLEGVQHTWDICIVPVFGKLRQVDHYHTHTYIPYRGGKEYWDKARPYESSQPMWKAFFRLDFWPP